LPLVAALLDAKVANRVKRSRPAPHEATAGGGGCGGCGGLGWWGERSRLRQQHTHSLGARTTHLRPDPQTCERLPPCTQAADEYDWEALRSWLRGISPPLSALAALQLFAQSAEACSRLHVEVVDDEGTV